jgi:ABC-type lipoprotein release transport system permease subunit
MNKTFWYYLFLNIYKDKKKHLGVLLISIVLIFLLSSSFFISSSIKDTLNKSLENQADFIVQKHQGGQRVNAPLSWQDKLLDIYGISKVTPRVYGRYYFDDKNHYGIIVGVDFFEEQSNKNLQKLVQNLDLKAFLAKNNMIIGQGIAKYLQEHFFNTEYTFLNPKGEFIKVSIYKTLPKDSNFASNNILIMPIELARKILGLQENEVSDFALSVPNKSEWNTIYNKLSALSFDSVALSKRDIQKAYENLYNYKGGFFLSLFLLSLVTFSLLLYYRYSTIFYSEKKDIGVLRALGWSIKDIIALKFFESLFIALFAYIIGVLLAYIYVFIFDAPLLRDIFLGNDNLNLEFHFAPIIDFRSFSSIFIIFIFPFIATTIIPVWKIAITNPKEAMK